MNEWFALKHHANIDYGHFYNPIGAGVKLRPLWQIDFIWTGQRGNSPEYYIIEENFYNIHDRLYENKDTTLDWFLFQFLIPDDHDSHQIPIRNNGLYFWSATDCYENDEMWLYNEIRRITE